MLEKFKVSFHINLFDWFIFLLCDLFIVSPLAGMEFAVMTLAVARGDVTTDLPHMITTLYCTIGACNVMFAGVILSVLKDD